MGRPGRSRAAVEWRGLWPLDPRGGCILSRMPRRSAWPPRGLSHHRGPQLHQSLSGRWEKTLRLQHWAQFQAQPSGQTSGEGVTGRKQRADSGRGPAPTPGHLASNLQSPGPSLQRRRCQQSPGPTPEGEQGRPGLPRPTQPLAAPAPIPVSPRPAPLNPPGLLSSGL